MTDYSDYLNYLHHIDDTTAQEFKKREDELRHQIDVVREQCRKDIKDIQERAAAEKAQLEADHKAAVEALNAKYQSEVEKLSNERKQLIKEHEAAIATLSSQSQSSVDKIAEEKSQLVTSHKAEIAKLKAEKTQLDASYKAEVSKLKAEKDAAEKELSSAMAQIEKRTRIAVDEALVKIKAEHENTVRTLRKQYQTSIDKLNADIKQLKDSHEREQQRITAEKDAQIIKLTEKLSKFEAEKFSFNKLITKIKEFVLSLFMSTESYIDDANERKRHKTEEKAQQEEVERLRQREERRRKEEELQCQREEDCMREEESRHKEENEPAGEERRFCRVCGNPLKPGAVFCNKCGTKVI